MNDLVIAVVVLNRDLDRQRIGFGGFSIEMNRLAVKNGLVLVQMLNELGDAALIEKLVRLLGSLVVDADSNTRIQESFLTQALRQSIEVVLGNFKYLGVGFE